MFIWKCFVAGIAGKSMNAVIVKFKRIVIYETLIALLAIDFVCVEKVILLFKLGFEVHCALWTFQLMFPFIVFLENSGIICFEVTYITYVVVKVIYVF